MSSRLLDEGQPKDFKWWWHRHWTHKKTVHQRAARYCWQHPLVGVGAIAGALFLAAVQLIVVYGISGWEAVLNDLPSTLIALGTLVVGALIVYGSVLTVASTWIHQDQEDEIDRMSSSLETLRAEREQVGRQIKDLEAEDEASPIERFVYVRRRLYAYEGALFQIGQHDNGTREQVEALRHGVVALVRAALGDHRMAKLQRTGEHRTDPPKIAALRLMRVIATLRTELSRLGHDCLRPGFRIGEWSGKPLQWVPDRFAESSE